MKQTEGVENSNRYTEEDTCWFIKRVQHSKIKYGYTTYIDIIFYLCLRSKAILLSVSQLFLCV